MPCLSVGTTESALGSHSSSASCELLKPGRNRWAADAACRLSAGRLGFPSQTPAGLVSTSLKACLPRKPPWLCVMAPWMPHVYIHETKKKTALRGKDLSSSRSGSWVQRSDGTGFSLIGLGGGRVVKENKHPGPSPSSSQRGPWVTTSVQGKWPSRHADVCQVYRSLL